MYRPLFALLLTSVSALAAAVPAAASVMNVTFLANTPQLALSTSDENTGSAAAGVGFSSVNYGVESPPGFFDLGVGGGFDLFALARGVADGDQNSVGAKAAAAASASVNIRVTNANPFDVFATFDLDLAYYLNATAGPSSFGPTAVPTSVTLTATVTDLTTGLLYSNVVSVAGPDQTASAATAFPFVVPLAGGQTRDLKFFIDISGSTDAGPFDFTSFAGSLNADDNSPPARFGVRVAGVTEAEVPEPATLATLAGLAGVVAVRRRAVARRSGCA